MSALERFQDKWTRLSTSKTRPNKDLEPGFVETKTEKALVVENLEKRYGSNRAVDGVSFSVKQGEIFALLGPNGAGKTTTLEILEGHRERSGGKVSVLGFDPEKGGRLFRERIGIVLQSSALERELTVSEAVAFYASIYSRPRPVDEVIEIVGLAEKAGARVKTLSGGQRRRLALALGIIGDPDLVFLDEPTTGFDPSARRHAWKLVRNLRDLGKTILLTTHYMDEAQNLADRIAVIVKGKIVAEGTPNTLGGRESHMAKITFALPRGISLEELSGLAGQRVTARDGVAELHAEQPTRVLHALTGWATERGVELDALEVARPSLEDIYLELAGEEGA